MAFLNKGLEIVVRDERHAMAGVAEAMSTDASTSSAAADRAERRAGGDRRRTDGGVIERRFSYDRGLVDYVEHLNRAQGPRRTRRVIDFEAELPDERA